MARLNVPLKMALLETGKKQKRVAHLLRIPEPTLSRIVRGRRPPTDEEREKLATFLGKDITDLFPSDAA